MKLFHALLHSLYIINEAKPRPEKLGEFGWRAVKPAIIVSKSKVNTQFT